MLEAKNKTIERPTGGFIRVLGYLIVAILILAPVTAFAGPWSVPGSWETEEREIRFESEGIELVGTLHIPTGAEEGPAIVVTHGAALGERGTPLYQQIAELMPALGYSVFVYDRRGSGESEGEDPAGRHFEELSKDAASALDAISREPEVDPDRIGIWGLSQGGWIAMKAANRSDAAFVISVAAPLTTTRFQMMALTRNYMKIGGYDDEARGQAAEVRQVVSAFIQGDASRDETIEKLEWAEQQSWFEHLYFPPTEEYMPMLEEARADSVTPWDPVDALVQIDVPILFMLGGEDFDIPVPETLDILDSLPEQENLELVVIPGADHLMVEINEPVIGEERKMVSDSPAYFLAMGHWLGLNVQER